MIYNVILSYTNTVHDMCITSTQINTNTTQTHTHIYIYTFGVMHPSSECANHFIFRFQHFLGTAM